MGNECNPGIRRRRSIRLRGYDYSTSGAYFVTVCSRNKLCQFGEIVDGTMRLSQAGELVCEIWEALPERLSDIDLDAFVVMPNHVHGIALLIGNATVGAGLALPERKGADVGAGLALPERKGADVGAGLALPNKQGAASSAPTLADVIGAFKSISAIEVNRLLGRTGQPLWQRNYYEHIIRNETGLNSIREYIAANPQNWAMDSENPAGQHATPY